jgi:hypothetical protein
MDVAAAGCSLLPAAEADTAAGPPPHDATICDKTMRTLRLRRLTVVRRRSQSVCHIRLIDNAANYSPFFSSLSSRQRRSTFSSLQHQQGCASILRSIGDSDRRVACRVLDPAKMSISWAGHARAQTEIPEFLRKHVDRAAAGFDGVTVAQRFITPRQKCFVECRRVRRRP